MLPATIFVCATGTYYIYHKERVNRTMANVSWEMSRLYIDCLDVQESIKTTLKNAGILEEEEESDGYLADDEDEDEGYPISSSKRKIEQNLVYYNRNDKLCFISDTINENTISEALKKSPSIIFIRNSIGGDDYYKRTLVPSNKDSTFDVFLEKPFIQVEYIEDGENAYDIHKYLTSFYVNGNTILDRVFLEWYLSYFYDKSCSDNYILRIIDKDISLFDVESNQTIILRNDMYEVSNILDEQVSKNDFKMNKLTDSESDGNDSNEKKSDEDN
jgi:hypothetical protein